MQQKYYFTKEWILGHQDLDPHIYFESDLDSGLGKVLFLVDLDPYQ